MGIDPLWSGSFRILSMPKMTIILCPFVFKSMSLGALDKRYHLRAVRAHSSSTANIPNKASTALETFLSLLR